MTTRLTPRANSLPFQPTLRQRLFAWVTHATESAGDRRLSPYKRRIFQNISGTVLEIGPGTGVNLAYLPAGIHWIAVEPNPAMHPHLQARARRFAVDADIRLGTAEDIDARADSVDVAVSTLVLCSVRDQEATLGEIHRVLKPGGRFIFLEHIAAEKGTRVRRTQDFIQPLWSFLADGCHPNRETWVALESTGFEKINTTRLWLDEPLSLTSPMIAGVATKGLLPGDN